MNEELKAFEFACEAMRNAKFIFMDKKLSEVLKSIAKSPKIFNYVAECMIGFNFGREFKNAVSVPNDFIAPADDKKFVALVFCLLNAIDDKKVDVHALLASNFKKDGQSSYSAFCDKIITRFENCIIGALGETPKEKAVTVENSSRMSEEVSRRLAFLISEIKPHLKSKRRKADLFYDCFILALEKREPFFAVGFFEALKPFANVRKVGTLLDEVDEILRGF